MLKAALRRIPGYQHAARVYWDARLDWSPKARLSAKSAAYDAELEEVIRRTLPPGRLGVDVGANIGDILVQMCRASTAPHLAFEPLPQLTAHLRARCPQAVVTACALSDTASVAKFRVVANSLAESSLAATVTHVTPDASWIDVEVRRLDDALPPDSPVALLKVDAEGAELPILRGAVHLLARDRPIVVFEAGGNTTPHFGVTPEHLFDFFDERGYAVTTMAAWLAGSAPLSRPRFLRRYIHEAGTDVLPWVGRKDWMFLAHPQG